MMRSWGRRIEIGVHRETDDFRGQAIADRHAGFADRVMLVGLLPVQGDRVINSSRNTFRLERRRQYVAPSAGKAQRILRPHRYRAGRNRRRYCNAGESSPSVYRRATRLRASISSGNIFQSAGPSANTSAFPTGTFSSSAPLYGMSPPSIPG